MSTTYLQPHEGIRGTRRDDGLLSLGEDAQAVRLWLLGMAAHLCQAVQVGQPAPIVAAMYERIQEPRLGDLVAEMSAIYDRRDPERQVKGLGVLIAHREEWATTDEEWERYRSEYPEDVSVDERWSDHAWYIQYGPGPDDICRWTNCSFRVLPAPDERFRGLL